MSEGGERKEESGATPPLAELSISATLSEDKKSANMKLTAGGSIVWEGTAGTASLDTLIRSLDTTRGQMLDQVSLSTEADKRYPSVFDPIWRVSPDPENRFPVLWIRNAGVGWYAYGFPRHEAAAIARCLRKTPEITTVDEKRTSLPSNTVSVGGEEFLLTTSGLGFYYYGKGGRRIGPNPFEQVEFDSDRAAGIVAGSIVERHLEEAIRCTMKDDNPDIARQLFRPSGPLGPFSNKIDLAYMLGMLSADAYKDLTNIKSVRNDFAHELEMDTFDISSINARCKNLVLIDRHIGPAPQGIDPPIGAPNPYYGLPDYKEKLADARFRYMMTAQLLSYVLGMAVDNPNRTIPYL